jgi:hypothetical protein
MEKIIIAASLLVCLACGGSSPASVASVNGTLAGQAMSAQDAVSNVLTLSGQSAGVIFITNVEGTCAKMQKSQQPKNSKIIVIELGTQTSTAVTAAGSPGAYTVYGSATSAAATGQVAIAVYSATDAVCSSVTELEATGGTITLTRVDANGYAGTFDITFSDTSHVTGSFGANKCAALGSPTSVCV